jgi:CheY-like chemotaxis protein
MHHRVLEILLVAPPYDAYVLEEAGELSERMLGEFRNLDLHYAPGLTAVATGAEALELLRTQRGFNLILATPRLADMHAGELARRLKSEGVDAPVVLLGRDLRELAELEARRGLEGIERAFVWQGDARILVAIVKSVEDARNAEHDAGTIGVQVILLVEDGVRQYSSFLPAMYTELLRHSQRVITEGLNLAQKILRMRARPKILLATSWEEAAKTALEEAAKHLEDMRVAEVEPPAGQLLQLAHGGFHGLLGALFLLDLEGVRQYRAVSESRRIKNLVQLHRTLGRYLRNVQKLRVLRAYLDRDSASRQLRRRISEQVVRESKRLDADKIRHGLGTPALIGN